jgi:hypothetical protein
MQVRAGHLAAQVRRRGDEGQVREPQPAQLSHPEAGPVEHIHDQPVQDVGTCVDELATWSLVKVMGAF